tara:strand:- start:8486 stop:9037 length:552 start_codon:yes stop_codon:yes gene_type:complete
MEQLSTKKPKRNWKAITGWVVAVLCAGFILWMQQKQERLVETISTTKQELTQTSKKLFLSTRVLELLRAKEFTLITLAGNQAVAPRAFSKVYINKKEQILYIDTKGLPEAPQAKTYQVWSLQMDPLVAKSLGLIDSSSFATTGFYKFNGIQENPEAFGITLEPSGGSKSPTLSKLYVLGNATP